MIQEEFMTKLPDTSAEAPSGAIIKKSRTVGTAPDAVWKKWTTHEGLSTFFGSDNRIELKIGGAFEIYFLLDNPPGLRGSEGCRILSFLPVEMISFTWNAPPSYPEIRNHQYKTWVVVTFLPDGKSGTTVKLSHLGWPSGKSWNDVYEYFVGAWDVVMNRFEASCK